MVESAQQGDIVAHRQEELRVYLLGGFRMSLGQQTIGSGDDEGGRWRLRKAKSLVKLLALAPGHRLHREQLVDLLWPDLGPEAAANNLRKAMHIARRTLQTYLSPAEKHSGSRRERAGMVVLEGESVTLRHTGGVWVDVEAFEAAAREARNSQEVEAHRTAIGLYEGDLLPEDRYEEWAAGRREGLRATYLELLLGLAQLHESRGELEPAVELLKQIVDRDPLQEQAHAELMRLYARSGATHKALRQYRQLRDTLRRELDVEPEEATTHLYEQIVVGRAQVQASGLPEAQRHNLPVQLTSFVGRQSESAEVKRLLSSTRLLTLTGPGGAGKTRLAIEVASGLAEQYAHGAWLVELASLSEPELVPQAVASALQVQEQPGRKLTETLVGQIAAKECLLILDNCEHLVGACAELAETILRGCPAVTILATSREALNVPGETAWTVPSLSLPERGEIPSARSLGQYEATRLFIDRAKSALAGFDPAERDAPVIARICSQVDGIPLAIELAAARVRVLSVEQIAERLNDALRLLTGGRRTAPPRHQTLSAAIDWSYNLLSRKEQALFRRLSVFAGGFTLEAVEEVCTGGSFAQREVLDVLARLVDKSLVKVPSSEYRVASIEYRVLTTRFALAHFGLGTRYSLLETLRQYGRERLEDNGGVESTEHRHAAYFRMLAEQAEPELRGERQVEWLGRLDWELDNLRAALDWSTRGDVGTGLMIVGCLWWFWEARGYQTEGRRWLAGLLMSSVGADAPARTIARARALHCGAALAMRQGDGAQALPMLSESLAIFEEAGDRRGVADVLERLGLGSYALGDYEESRKVLAKSLALFRELDDKPGMGWTLSDLGMVTRIEGNHEAARSLLEESLACMREAGDRLGLSYALNNLGQLMRVEGRFGRAQELLEESLAAAREVGNKPFIGWALLCLGEVARRQGNLAWARACFAEGLRVTGEVGNVRHVAQGLGGLGVLAVQEGGYRRGVRLIGAADALHAPVRSSLDTDEKASWDASLAQAGDALGESGLDDAWEEGRRMVLERVVVFIGGRGAQVEGLSVPRGGMEQAIEYAQEHD